MDSSAVAGMSHRRNLAQARDVRHATLRTVSEYMMGPVMAATELMMPILCSSFGNFDFSWLVGDVAL